MARTQVEELDDTGWRLLRALQAEGRAPLKSLATSAGLSVAATAERLKRLQETGVVRRFSVDVDPSVAGYPIKASVGITAKQPGKKTLLEILRNSPEVLESSRPHPPAAFQRTLLHQNLHTWHQA